MSLRAKHILVVEDAADSREAFAHLLRAEGAEVVTTGSGREALEHLARVPFAVVLTDLGLPDIPGDILIREVLAFTLTRPRIVAMTGYGEPYLSRARAAGADAADQAARVDPPAPRARRTGQISRRLSTTRASGGPQAAGSQSRSGLT